MFSVSELGEKARRLSDLVATQEETWSEMSLLQREIHQIDALLTVIGSRNRTDSKWIGSPDVRTSLLALCQAAENRYSPNWHAMSPPNRVVIIGMVAVIEKEQRELFETIGNPTE